MYQGTYACRLKVALFNHIFSIILRQEIIGLSSSRYECVVESYPTNDDLTMLVENAVDSLELPPIIIVDQFRISSEG